MSDNACVIEVSWSAPPRPLPRMIGPFASVAEAEDWGKLNVVNGTWHIVPIAFPYEVAGSHG